jgi:hypothetical protein
MRGLERRKVSKMTPRSDSKTGDHTPLSERKEEHRGKNESKENGGVGVLPERTKPHRVQRKMQTMPERMQTKLAGWARLLP